MIKGYVREYDPVTDSDLRAPDTLPPGDDVRFVIVDELARQDNTSYNPWMPLDKPRDCRFMLPYGSDGKRRACHAPSVVAIRRGYGLGDWHQLWGYCAKHVGAYSARWEDGKVLRVIVVGKEDRP